MSIERIKADLKKYSSKEKAKLLQSFFKTGPGGYAQEDIFIGVVVPDLRKLAKKYQSLELKEIISFIKSRIHEERFLALLILILKYEGAKDKDKKLIFDFYLKYIQYINNWDLVDLSCHKILGAFLFKKDKEILYKLASAKSLWRRRVAIVSTYYFIKNNQFQDALKLSYILLHDQEDLIHKALGWMLREVGKRDSHALEGFLNKYASVMPRTALRYAIERFPELKRKAYLKVKKEK